MTHIRNLLDPSKYLGPQDFPKEIERTIAAVAREQLPQRDDEKGPAQFAVMLYFLDKAGQRYPRPMKLPKLLIHGLTLQYGSETDAWVGKVVVVYPAKCMAFGDVAECLRFKFPAAIEDGVQKHIKKRKLKPSAYILREQGQA